MARSSLGILKLTMIFLKQSYILGFLNLVGDSPTWPNFYAHKKFDAHQKVHGLGIYIYLTYTYPFLSEFKATFLIPPSLPHDKFARAGES